jgi:hypothetical protein
MARAHSDVDNYMWARFVRSFKRLSEKLTVRACNGAQAEYPTMYVYILTTLDTLIDEEGSCDFELTLHYKGIYELFVTF